MNINNTSPNIQFDINVVGPSQPVVTDGIIHIVAVTSMGPDEDPRDLITSIPKFREIFGEELMLGNSLSNIEKALEMGASVRISRVKGIAADINTWKSAASKFIPYEDSYVIASSQVYEYINKNLTVYAEYLEWLKDNVLNSHNSVCFAELPKELMGTLDSVKNSIGVIKDKIGSTPWVSIFGGGLKYLDANGNIVDCNCLGTVLGLSAISEKSSGPWYHFSGMNRGKVTSSVGLTGINWGSNSNFTSIKELATLGLNVFVIKNTRQDGKVPMLWHNFTSLDSKSSFRFLGIIRLLLYIKKHIGNILERYLEEPNIIETWNSIYYEAEPILNDLTDREAITFWEWQGDQNISSMDQVSINNLTDIYSGIYRVKLVIREVLALQDIVIDITLNSPESNISISIS